MTNTTSSPSVPDTTSIPLRGPTGRRRTAHSFVPISEIAESRVILGPAPCQGCGAAVEYIEWIRYRYWSDFNSVRQHICELAREPEPEPPEPAGTPLHVLIQQWKDKVG